MKKIRIYGAAGNFQYAYPAEGIKIVVGEEVSAVAEEGSAIEFQMHVTEQSLGINHRLVETQFIGVDELHLARRALRGELLRMQQQNKKTCVIQLLHAAIVFNHAPTKPSRYANAGLRSIVCLRSGPTLTTVMGVSK